MNSFKAALRFSTFEIHSGLIPKSFTEPLRAFSVSSTLLKSLLLPFLNSISLFAIFMQVTIIMRISTVVVKPLIAGAFSGIVFPIAVCLIVLDWFKDSMKNILIWFINNLFILVLAIPILLFGVLALLAFNLTITPSVAIQNINQGGLGIDSTIASLITLFILKGFIETIIESVNAIVNTIFSSVSMDGSRMDRERDALMVGRVGGSMFKG
ncbi:cag pathogenicity island protein [Helicobacter pylori 908]|nr:cag pathogenicity island protein [Helicobacter pylori 908]